MKRHKLLNIHYLGGNGGEFLASYLQLHHEFNQHNTDQRDDLVKYSYKRDDYDHLSQIYLGLGTDRCLANYSPKKFFQELWETSNDKWTLRIDHGYGYIVQEEEWIKGLYSDWNLSKTIILNTTELEGSKYCRDLAQIKVFGKGTHEIENIPEEPIKSYPLNRMNNVLHDFSAFNIGDFCRKQLEFNQLAT